MGEKELRQKLIKFVSQKVADPQDVEDIVQVSFLQLYKSVKRLDEKKPVSPYLYQIVRNEMKMFWRRQKPTLPLNEEIVAEEQAEKIDLDFIKKQLLKLNIEQKKALQLISEGFSYKEISKFLVKPINTIRTVIRRARLKLTQGKKHDKT